MEDIYARRVEKAIFNWYYGGEQSSPEPIFNALHDGFQNEMQVSVPIETPEAMLQMMGDPTQVKVGDTFTNEEPIAIKFRHLVVNGDGEYFIPVFTSNEERRITSNTRITLSTRLVLYILVRKKMQNCSTTVITTPLNLLIRMVARALLSSEYLLEYMVIRLTRRQEFRCLRRFIGLMPIKTPL